MTDDRVDLRIVHKLFCAHCGFHLDFDSIQHAAMNNSVGFVSLDCDVMSEEYRAGSDGCLSKETQKTWVLSQPLFGHQLGRVLSRVRRVVWRYVLNTGEHAAVRVKPPLFVNF